MRPTSDEAGACSQQARPLGDTNPAPFSYPDPGSVKGRLLADLLTGARVTHLDVWERHGSSRAAHHVLMLRKAGWPILTKEIDALTSDGRVARIALYSLPAGAIDATGERGQQYVAEAGRVEAERRGL